MVISLTKQLANAESDLARTIESPANQMKILQQQLQRLQIALGGLFEIAMQKVLPVLNGMVMALTTIVQLITEYIKALVGYEEIEYDYSGLTGTDDALDDLIEGLQEASDESKKLKKNLIGIDELNILQPSDEESISDQIDPTIMQAYTLALSNWDNMMDKVQMKAYKIRDAILEWVGIEPTADGFGFKEGETRIRKILGLIDLANNKIEEITGERGSKGIKILLSNVEVWITNLWNNLKTKIENLKKLLSTISLPNLNDLRDNLERMWEQIDGIILLIAGLKFPQLAAILQISQAIKDINKNGANLGNILKLLEGIGWALLAIGTTLGLPAFTGLGLLLVGIGETIKGINGYLEDGKMDLDDLIQIIVGIGMAIAGLAMLGLSGTLNTIFSTIKNGIANIKLFGTAIVEALGGNAAAKSAMTFMLGNIDKIVGGITIVAGAISLIWGIFDWIKDGNLSLEAMEKILNGIGLVLIGIGLLTGNWVLAIVGGIILIISWITKLKGENSAMFDNLKVIFERIKESFKRIIEAFKPLYDSLSGGLGSLFDLLKLIVNTVIEIISAMIAFILPLIEGAVNIIADVIETAVAFIGGVLAGIIDVLKGIIDFIVGVFTGDWEKAFKGIGNIFIGIVNLMITAVEGAINIIVTIINTILNLVLGAIKGLINAVASAIESVASVIGIKLNLQIRGAIPQIPTARLKRIPTYESGGYPSKGMFIANEGSSMEMLGTINGRAAVVNNQEIASALAQALTPLLGTVVNAVENVAASDRAVVVNVDSREIARANQKGNSKLGFNQIGGEFANV